MSFAIPVGGGGDDDGDAFVGLTGCKYYAADALQVQRAFQGLAARNTDDKKVALGWALREREVAYTFQSAGVQNVQIVPDLPFQPSIITTTADLTRNCIATRKPYAQARLDIDIASERDGTCQEAWLVNGTMRRRKDLFPLWFK